MKLRMDKNYLILPLGFHAVSKKLKFYKENALVFDIDANLDMTEPDYVQYLDVKRFYGMELDIEVSPVMELALALTDEPDSTGLYREKYRPQIHFTAKSGWLNDPNGLVYYNGVYHMFFQYNPAGHLWGNMTWGHAVSRDLLHWQEQDCALYPDELGAMFSGSAIVDKDNVLGLKEGAADVLALYYTAAGGCSLLSEGREFSQCMAFSTDGGATFQKYSGNPVVSPIEGQNRDPKVIYSAELNAFVMALFLNENTYALLKSSSLIDWERMQELVLPGDAECPDFYPLPTDGDKTRLKWIFSGASDYYLVGEIRDGAFCPDQPVKKLHHGKNSYAAQTFSPVGAKDGRTIRVAWNTMNAPQTRFTTSLCFPTEMKLCTIDGEPRLCALPVDEIRHLYKQTVTRQEETVTAGRPFAAALQGKSQDISLRLLVGEASEFSLCLFGMEIVCKVKENLVQFLDATMPLCIRDHAVSLRLIIDTLGLEIFADQGQAYMCTGFLCDYNLNHFEIKAHQGSLQLLNGAFSELKSIWQEEQQV